MLFCTFKQSLSGKFRGNLKKYQPLLSLINQRHWQWQVDMMWEILFNRPIQEESYSMIEILINFALVDPDRLSIVKERNGAAD